MFCFESDVFSTRKRQNNAHAHSFAKCIQPWTLREVLVEALAFLRDSNVCIVNTSHLIRCIAVSFKINQCELTFDPWKLESGDV